MWVIVGLGNPGARYRRTRHNVGFRVVDTLAARWRAEGAREAHQAEIREARRDGARVLLVKPLTFMNRSGEAIGSLARYFHFGPEDLVAVHDDVDLPVGRLRLRRGGGAGGHHGVESLMVAVGAGFWRLRVGVGRPPAGRDGADWVLSPPTTPEEAAALADAERRAADGIEILLGEGPSRAMNRINQREAVHGGSPL